MNLEMAGLRAIVTGGTRGIGRAIIERLLLEGCAVSFCARNHDSMKEASSDFDKSGNAFGNIVDVRDKDALRKWVENSERKLGGIDLVVCNASSMALGSSDEAFNAAFEIDLIHTKTVVESSLDALKSSNSASILAVSSISGVQDFGFDEVAYGSLKAALLFYIKGLSTKLGRDGIRANSLSPGPIYVPNGTWTDMELNDPSGFDNMIKRTPLRRMGTPDEVARAAVFLLSPAASFITGANLVVDGGHTRRIQN